jgi:hypothetical protein
MKWHPEKRTPGTTPANADHKSPNAGIVAQQAAERKAFTTLQAQAALAGCELHALAAGGFLLSRWGLTRELRSIDEVRQMLAQMGCKS